MSHSTETLFGRLHAEFHAGTASFFQKTCFWNAVVYIVRLVEKQTGIESVDSAGGVVNRQGRECSVLSELKTVPWRSASLFFFFLLPQLEIVITATCGPMLAKLVELGRAESLRSRKSGRLTICHDCQPQPPHNGAPKRGQEVVLSFDSCGFAVTSCSHF